MKQKEMEREGIIKDLVDGNITTKESAAILDLSERQIKRLKSGYLKNGSRYLVHGNRNRKPAHSLQESLKKKVFYIICNRYQNKSYDAIKDLLGKDEGIEISVSSIRRIIQYNN